MIGRMFHKVLRISRGMALATGAVVICAVVLGAATSALAAAPGDPFRLGKVNAVNNFTKLVGKANSPRLVIDNNGNGVALRLLVEPGKPPMQVNSGTKVAHLNADKLDGQDSSAFVPADTNSFLKNDVYKAESAIDTGTVLGDGTFLKDQACNPGDVLLSGGPANINATSTMVESFPTPGSTNSWRARIDKNGVADNFSVVVLCVNQ